MSLYAMLVKIISKGLYNFCWEFSGKLKWYLEILDAFMKQGSWKTLKGIVE